MGGGVRQPATRAHEHVAVAPTGADLRMGAAAGAAARCGRDERRCAGLRRLDGRQLMPPRRLAAGVRTTSCVPRRDTRVAPTRRPARAAAAGRAPSAWWWLSG